MTPRKPEHLKLKVGRKTEYNEESATEICSRLAVGESLRSICKDKHMPVQQTVYNWMFRNPEFMERYTRAREEQAETYADQIVDIADETPTLVPLLDKDGNVIDVKMDSAYLMWQKNRMDARKWTAMKLKPKRYGDKVTHAGDDANPVVIEQNLNVFGELLKNIELRRQTEKK
jgi:hypothetical protein